MIINQVFRTVFIINLCFTFLLNINLSSAKDIPFGFQFTNPKAKFVKIPIETYHNLVLVPIQIGKSFTMQFILDTGVKTMILTETAIAPFLGLEHTRPIKVLGLGEKGVINATVASNLDIKLPNIEGKRMNLIVLPANTLSFSSLFGKSVFGIIGYDLFRQFTVEINYQEKYIKLYKPNTYKINKKYNIFPIVIEKTKPYIKAQVTNEDGSTTLKKLLIDSGATHALSLWQDEQTLPSRTIDSYLGNGLSGSIFGKIGRIKELKIGDYKFENIITSYPDTASLNVTAHSSLWHGGIGAEILRRFQVVFDYQNERLFLKKNKHFKKPFFYNISGIEISANGSQFNEYLISHIRPNSVAEKAGILEGDEIIAINRQSIIGLNIRDIYYQLNRKAGKKLHFKLLRNGKKVNIGFRLIEEI